MSSTLQGSRRAVAQAILWAACAWPSMASAYRPFDSTDAAVAEKGRMEIELGPVGFVKDGSGSFLVVPGVIFNWGVADRCELVLEGRQFVQLGSGIGGRRFAIEDAAFSLKAVLREGGLQGKPGLSLATELGSLLPSVDGTSGAGAQVALIASQRWPDLTVHLNGAAAWSRTHRAGLFGGAILEIHDAWPIRPVGELFVEGERNAPTTLSALAGAIWRLGDDFSLDAAVRLARAGGVNTTELRAGLTWGFSVGVPR